MRLSRWSRDPILDEKGKAKIAHITAHDIGIFNHLNPERYRYLPANYLHALLGGDYSSLRKRLEILTRKPNCFLNRPQQQCHFANANYRHLIYELDENGRSYLIDAPRVPAREFFAHQVMIDTSFASIELGARPARIILPAEILAYRKFPAEFRDEAKPFSIPVCINRRFRDRTHHAEFDYTSDGLRGIEFPDRSYRFIQLEAEHRNRVNCSNLHQTSFLKKFLALAQIHERKLYQKRWGIPNLFTLVVAPTQERIETMKELILRETGGKGSPHIGFRVVPVLEDIDRKLVPDPTLFTGTWERAGYPPHALKGGD